MLLNKKTKTDVWALVGIVDHDYSDTTSDSQIHVIFDFRIVSEPWILDGKARALLREKHA